MCYILIVIASGHFYHPSNKGFGKQMEAIRRQQTVQKKGEVLLRGLPVEVGQEVEIVVLLLPRPTAFIKQKQSRFTAADLLQSGLVGLWANRIEIADSATYARQLREQGQRRSLIIIGDEEDDFT